MTREEMWKEFEYQLIRETRISMTMSFDAAQRMTKLGIEETVAKWKKRLEQTRWIPVSEKLPERDVSVLTYHRNVSFDYQYVSWIDDYSGEWAGFIGSLSDEVLAWMPLPQPYNGESEEKA